MVKDTFKLQVADIDRPATIGNAPWTEVKGYIRAAANYYNYELAYLLGKNGKVEFITFAGNQVSIKREGK